MAFKCYDCGHIFDECEREEWKEPHGELMDGCPLCKGNYAEAKRCKICGGDFLKEELYGGCVCGECIEEHKQDLKTCYAIAETADKQEIEINALLASVFDIAEIEEILYQYLKAEKEVDCSSFINEDKDWFAKKLVEEVSE